MLVVNKTWLSRYPRCCYIIYNNGSEFKLNFEYLCVTYGIKRKPTTIKNLQAKAILERLHKVLAKMLCAAELDMAKTVILDDVDIFLDMRHGSFALPNTQSLKPLQAWHFLDATSSSKFRS
jgi:hypothetical protein